MISAGSSGAGGVKYGCGGGGWGSRAGNVQNMAGSPVRTSGTVDIGDSPNKSSDMMSSLQKGKQKVSSNAPVDSVFISRIPSAAQLTISDSRLSQVRELMLSHASKAPDVITLSEFASGFDPEFHLALDYLNMCRNATQVENFGKAIDLLHVQAGKISFLQSEISRLQSNAFLLQQDHDKFKRESTSNANMLITACTLIALLLGVFSPSDFATAAILDRELLFEHFSLHRAEFEDSELDLDNDEYENLKFEFMKSIALVSNLRFRIRTLKGDVKRLRGEKDKATEAGEKALQDCRAENLELRPILKKIRTRLRIEGNGDFDKALENEKKLKDELSQLRKKFEESQHELEAVKGDGGPSSHQIAELSNRLAFVNTEITQTKSDTSEYKELIDAKYSLLKRWKVDLLISANRQAQRLCNQMTRETANLITTENGLHPNFFLLWMCLLMYRLNPARLMKKSLLGAKRKNSLMLRRSV